MFEFHRSNMAFNRQTRMLANLSESGCYRQQSNLTNTQREEIMLKSAKKNLAGYFDFFGLMEYQHESQLLLEKTFLGLELSEGFDAVSGEMATDFITLSETHWEIVAQNNLLDIRLHQYAKDLFLQRSKYANIPVKLNTDHQNNTF